MSEPTGSNRRRFQRIETDFPVLVESGGKRFEARVQNVSQGGLQIESPGTARVGEVSSITYGKAATTENFRTRITWARPAGSAFQFGGLFWAVDDEAKRQLLLRLIRYSTLYVPIPKPAEASVPAIPEAVSAKPKVEEAEAEAKKQTAPDGIQGGLDKTASGIAGAGTV